MCTNSPFSDLTADRQFAYRSTGWITVTMAAIQEQPVAPFEYMPKALLYPVMLCIALMFLTGTLQVLLLSRYVRSFFWTGRLQAKIGPISHAQILRVVTRLGRSRFVRLAEGLEGKYRVGHDPVPHSFDPIPWMDTSSPKRACRARRSASSVRRGR